MPPATTEATASIPQLSLKFSDKVFSDCKPLIHGFQHNLSDVFDNGGLPVYTHKGTWAETAPHTVNLGGDASETATATATAHLTLRDGDEFFASENLPWAELIVNDETVDLPATLRSGDVIMLRARVG